MVIAESSAMEETGQEEMRPEYGASDNGLEEGGFVEVTREDAQMAPAQSWAQQTAVDDLDPFAPVERAAAEGLEEEERVRERPPHPARIVVGECSGPTGVTVQTCNLVCVNQQPFSLCSLSLSGTVCVNTL